MKPIYEKVENEMGGFCIRATYEDGLIKLIPPHESNSDYERYLRWLENPDADESGTL